MKKLSGVRYPPEELALILDNIGLPVGGVDLAFSDSATVGAGDGEILVALKHEHRSTWEYIKQLRQTLQNAIEQFGLGFTPQERLRKRLGHCIKLLRVERNWSLKELATAAKLSVSQISSIERGTNLPSVESLLAISRAFNRKPSELLASIDF